VYELATAIYLVLGTTQRGFGYCSLGSIDEIFIDRLRQPLPEASWLRCPDRGARRFINGNDAHRALSHYPFR
jgi:hypothetical protein